MGSAVVALVAAAGNAFVWPRHVVACAVTAFVASLADTALYRGPGDNATAAWLLVETAGQLCVLAQVTRRAPAVATLGVVAVGVSPLRIGLWLTPPSPAGEVVGVCAVLTLVAAAGVALGTYLRSLDRARVRSVDDARREQRLRLARDLHDFLAHEMTGIVLAAQAGQLDGTDPPRTFRQIEEAGVRGLDAMDQALRLLRAETDQPPSSLAEVRAVVDRFEASSTAEVTCELDLPEPRPEVAATVHRVVVESLTNIRRHAPNATSVRITVTREEADVVVAVTDDGDGDGRSADRRGGTGLSGLARQVATAGGTFTAGPVAPGGWVVRVAVPA